MDSNVDGDDDSAGASPHEAEHELPDLWMVEIVCQFSGESVDRVICECEREAAMALASALRQCSLSEFDIVTWRL